MSTDTITIDDIIQIRAEEAKEDGIEEGRIIAFTTFIKSKRSQHATEDYILDELINTFGLASEQAKELLLKTK